MSRRSDNITISSPAGSSNAPAVREVVRIVTSVMPDPTAFTRGDEWTQSDAGDPIDWHLYIHNGTTWVEKYVNPEGKFSPVSLANQTKSVNSPTDPMPDYIGQPGVDSNGNDYVAIALSGTMWRKKTNSDTKLAEGTADEVSAALLSDIASYHNADGVLEDGGGLGAGIIATEHIADKNVTTIKLADKSVTKEKIGDNLRTLTALTDAPAYLGEIATFNGAVYLGTAAIPNPWRYIGEAKVQKVIGSFDADGKSIEAASILTDRRYEITLGIDSSCYLEEGSGSVSTDSAYIKGSSLFIRGGGNSAFMDVTRTWTELIGGTGHNGSLTFATSPLGVTNCLKLDHQKCLVWDKSDSLLKVVQRDSTTSSQLILFECLQGRIERGSLLGWKINRMQTTLNNKQDKAAGKGLSTNDLTNALKTNYDNAATRDTLEITLGKESTCHLEEGDGENSTSSAYIRGTSVFVRGGANKDYAWADLYTGVAGKQDGSLVFVTSPGGWSNCLKLDHQKCWVIDRTDWLLKIVSRDAVTANQVVLFECLFGRLEKGYLMGWKLNRITSQVNANTTNISNKQDKEAGKGLSANDLSNTLKAVYDYNASRQKLEITFGKESACHLEEGDGENTTSSAYIRGTAFYVRGNGYAITYNWADIYNNVAGRQDGSLTFVTSPLGWSNCLKLDHQKCLVFDRVDNLLKVVSRDNILDSQVVLFECLFGRLEKGELLGWKANRMLTTLNNKVDKEAGKGLSTNDFTSALKSNYDNAFNIAMGRHYLSPVYLVAHRGLNGLAPENTLEAVRLAAEYGYRSVEFDITYSSDGQLVVIHDDTVDRTTDGTGTVSAMTLAQLKALSADNGFPEYVGSRIPTFLEMLSICKDLGLTPFIELKFNATDAQAAEVLSTVRKCFPDEQVEYHSWGYGGLLKLRALAPKSVYSYVWYDWSQAEYDTLINNGFKSVLAPYYNINQAYFDNLVAQGINVVLWTLNQTGIAANRWRPGTVFMVDSAVYNFNHGIYTLAKSRSDFSGFTLNGNPVSNGEVVISGTDNVELMLDCKQGDVIKVRGEAHGDASTKVAIHRYIGGVYQSEEYAINVGFGSYSPFVCEKIMLNQCDQVKIVFSRTAGSFYLRHVSAKIYSV
jgi:glycerophosphoryl diester phosphodiesterase